MMSGPRSSAELAAHLPIEVCKGQKDDPEKGIVEETGGKHS
jgi:hypothetical protein